MGKFRRVSATILLTTALLVAGTYFTVFHHPPASVILSNNQKQSANTGGFKLDPHRAHSIAEISQVAWGKWLYDNKHVSIGDIYDSVCGEYMYIIMFILSTNL